MNRGSGQRNPRKLGHARSVAVHVSRQGRSCVYVETPLEAEKPALRAEGDCAVRTAGPGGAEEAAEEGEEGGSAQRESETAQSHVR